MKRVLVIGGGPCGMMTAITLKKENPDYQVTLIEKDNSLGKRIKVSGNGRCNFSNDNIALKFYNTNDQILHNILELFKNHCNDIYDDLHIHYYKDDEGRMYPVTNSSLTVLNALKKKLVSLGVEILLGTEFLSYEYLDSRFLIETTNGKFEAEILVLATGGASYLHNDQIHHYLLTKGIKITKLKPSLCPLKIKEKIPHNVVGKRTKAHVTLLENNKKIFYEDGEVIFKKDGISGIVIFNLSSVLTRCNSQQNKYVIELDFAKNVDDLSLNNEIKNYSKYDVLSSYVIEEIASWIDYRYSDINQGLHHFMLTFDGFYPLKDSQVTSGGVSLEEMDKDKLHHKKNPQLYIGGELLDVDGRCGGYNIFFAMACGYFIGKSI